MKKIYFFLVSTLLFSFVTRSQVVINEVYGGGGNSGAIYRNDFIELYNNGSVAVDLTGWSVQYASSTGSTWQRTNLTGTIPANGYFLIQQAQGAGGTTNLPTPNVTGTIAMSGTAGKVALVNNTTTITSGIVCPAGAQIIDFVGYGAANCFEGAGPAPALTNTTSAQRSPQGNDTNNNNTDFVSINPPTPIGSSAGDVTAPAITSLFPDNNATNVNTSFTAGITFSETIQKGTSGTITVRRWSDGVAIQTINLANVTVSGSTAYFDITSLAFNTSYYIEISSGTFKDLSNNIFTGISGSTTWKFTTALTSPTGSLGATYNFTTCSTNLPDGFTQYSVVGDQKWSCTTFGRDAANPTASAPNGVQINGFTTTNVPNEDWLISPAFDLTATAYPLLSFWSRTRFNGDPLELKISTDYTGTGDPRLATWTDLNGRFPVQTSDVWTLSENINLSSFKAAKVFIAFVYTSSDEEGARWTIDDFKIENSATPPPPSFSTSTTDIQFTYVANGSSADKNFLLTANDITTDVILTVNGNFLLSKDGSLFSSSITYSLAEANNISKTVFVRFAPTQKDQNYTGAVNISTSGLTATVNLKGSSINPAGTLEVVNWNIEWFGSITLGPVNDNLQLQNVTTILNNIGADIYGLTEVVDEIKLALVVSQMPGYSYVIGNYGSHVVAGSPLSEAQKLAFVYKTSVFSNITTRPLINNLNTTSTSYNNWSSGRYPFLMSADITLNCITTRVNFVLIHAKANTAPTAISYARRQAAAQELHDTLTTYFSDANVIILGDFNDDLDRTITDGINPPVTSYSSFTTDNANFFSPTLALSLEGKKSTVSYNDVIDHVIVSNEVQPYYMTATASILTDVASLVNNYAVTTSDHYPVFTRYRFAQPAAPVITTCPSVAAFCASSTNNYTIPVFTATSNCGAVRYSYQISGATVRSGSSNDASGVYNIGTSIITWTATDDLENISTCQTTVVINANPVVTIPDAFALSSGVLANTVYIGYSPASSLTLTSNVTGAPISSYNWSNGATASSTIVSPTTNTTYTLTVTDVNGCQATATKTVTVLDLRTGKKMDKVFICHKSKNHSNTLQVDPAAVSAHLAHGDMLASCSIGTNTVTSRDLKERVIIENSFSVKALPNPSNSYFVIQIGGGLQGKISLKVTDVLGRTMEQRNNLHQSSNVVIGNNYRPGVYIVEITDGNTRKQMRLLKTSE